ncbi:MAG: glutaredoxin family protein [Sandaracinaceae bacterium]
MTRLLTSLVIASVAGCGGGAGSGSASDPADDVEPPFEVRGEAEGLLLTWFDESGIHVAPTRSAVPEERRGAVRVDDLDRPPEARPDPDHVYVADLTAPGEDGTYPVRRMARSAFDALVEQAAAVAEPDVPALGDGEVVLYGASWCSACRGAAGYLRERGIPFVEREVERDPGAREAMLRSLERAGLRGTGIPVIDVGGRVVQGFDRTALDRAIAAAAAI